MRIISFFVFMSLGFQAQAVSLYKPTKSNVSFVAVGRPAMLKIKGHTDKMVGEVTVDGSLVNGEVTVNLASLETGIETRDDHMKKRYLETDAYPDAKLKIENLKIPTDSLKGQKTAELPFEGVMTLHGVQQKVSGKMSYQSTDKSIQLTAKCQLNLKDFKIETPSYAGLKVVDVVDVETEITLSGN